MPHSVAAPDSIPADADSVGHAMFAKRLAQVATMHRAGVRILTGTDAPLRNSPPGFGLHEDAVTSAVHVARALGVAWPRPSAASRPGSTSR